VILAKRLLPLSSGGTPSGTVGCATKTPESRSPGPSRTSQAGLTQVIELAVTSDGFVPAEITVHAGQPVKLLVTRKTERTCATEIVIRDLGINQALPLNQAVEVAFTPTSSGTMRYACGMDMIAGKLIVQ